ncbi:hypothetical protein TRVL_06801 [Trypanosoma vivax]|nr:hypothetical protein TRVL_06801 [Trypanosoma vivax]
MSPWHAGMERRRVRLLQTSSGRKEGQPPLGEARKQCSEGGRRTGPQGWHASDASGSGGNALFATARRASRTTLGHLAVSCTTGGARALDDVCASWREGKVRRQTPRRGEA